MRLTAITNVFVTTEAAKIESRLYIKSSTPERYCQEGNFQDHPLFPICGVNFSKKYIDASRQGRHQRTWKQVRNLFSQLFSSADKSLKDKTCLLLLWDSLLVALHTLCSYIYVCIHCVYIIYNYKWISSVSLNTMALWCNGSMAWWAHQSSVICVYV